MGQERKVTKDIVVAGLSHIRKAYSDAAENAIEAVSYADKTQRNDLFIIAQIEEDLQKLVQAVSNVKRDMRSMLEHKTEEE